MGVAGLVMLVPCTWAAPQVDEPNRDATSAANRDITPSRGVTQFGASLLASAVLFGTSMWNIPSSVTNLAKRALPKQAWGSALASFTIVFSIKQIIGPVATGWLADQFGSLRIGLAPAVGVLAAGALIALAQRDEVCESGKETRK